MRELQVVVTVLSIVLTGGLLVRQLKRSTQRIRVRPRLELVRIVIQFVAIIVVAALLGTGAPILALVFVGLLAVGPGYAQGKNLVLNDEDGRIYAVRNTVAAAVWGVGLVIMQVAGLLKRTGILGLGQATAWIGVGLAVGLMIGRRGPLAEYRRSTQHVALPVAGAVCVLCAVVAFGGTREAEAHARVDLDRVALVAATDDESREGVIYELVETIVNPGDRGDPVAPDSISDSSMSIQLSSNSTNPTAPTGVYNITWSGPPDTVVGETIATLTLNVSASLIGDGGVIAEFIDMRLWLIEEFNFDDVPAFMPDCGEPCAEVWGSPALTGTSSFDMEFDVPRDVDEFTMTLQGLCDSANPDSEYGPCAVQWRYEARGGSPVSSDAQSSDTDQLEDFIEQQSDDNGIEPDEAMQAALAGVLAALATGGISLLEAMDQVTRIFEHGSTVDRRPPMDDPVAIDLNGIDEEYSDGDESDTESARRTGSLFEEHIADVVGALPPPGPGADIGPYLEWLRQMAEQGAEQGAHWQRPFDPAEFGRVWDALGVAASDPSVATADELRQALADLLDRNVGGVPTWLVSWAARNPAAAGEMLVRMGAAYASGGASELALIPWDVNRDITSARDAATQRGEPFEFGDAVLAGARGQMIGWVVDGAGAAANAQRRAAGETLAEIAARSEARAAAGGLDEAADSLARTAPDADDLLEASRRNTDPDAWRGMDNEPAGSKIPPEHIRETGYTPEQARELQRVAAEQNVLIGTRETNLDATRWIEAGEAIPKPMAVKAKTLNELDALIGGPPADKKGLVGFFEPTEPKMPREANPELWNRFDARAAEWDKLKAEMDMMQAAGYEVRDGVVSKVMPDGSTMPFAGDIDAVAILDAGTGKPVSGARYQEVVDELRSSGARLQHGAETNVVNDIVAHETRGTVRGTREYNEAFDRAMDKATALGDKLNQNHLDGKEQVFWTHARGHYRGPQMRRLGDWQAMTAAEIPNRIADPVELAATLRPVTQAIASDE